MSKKMTILVTGASGFLGRALIKELLEKRYQVHALSSQKEAVKLAHDDQVKVYDVRELENNKIDWVNVDCLIHCAFSTKNDRESLAESLAFSKLVFNQAAKKGVSKLINFSTRSVYGNDASLETDEKARINPLNEYGLAKYASELLLEGIAERAHARFVNLRLSSLLGVDYEMRLVNKFIKGAIDKGVINIVGGEQVFSFMDVRDAVGAVIKLLESETDCWDKTYNLGCNKQYSIAHLAELVSSEVNRRCGIDVAINIEEKDVTISAGMDSSLFFKALNWQPEYSISETIESIVSANIGQMN